MLNSLIADFKIIFERDPAARNWLEVLFCYPGLQAIVMHRFSHQLYRWHLPFIPRLLSHLARFFTGIEIHPGAQFGEGVFIDHGMGVVIGETAVVGDDCLIYHGVTLGGKSAGARNDFSGRRHPKIGDRVTVGALAVILGPVSVGDDAVIGAHSVVLEDVPPGSVAVGVPAVVKKKRRG